MAISSGVFSTAFLSPETASFLIPSLRPSLIASGNLRMVRTVTLATASKPATGKSEPRGIRKPRPVSPEMQALVGVPEIPRTQALKQIWAYIKEHNLQKCLALYAEGLRLLSLGSEVNPGRVICLVHENERGFAFDPENKKVIVCDEKLKKIFGGKDRVGFLEIAGLISPHFL
ncbi:hypothetical protein Pint_33759 [Pistacia integerrima]|uniref:Uncharacterized protein n=1 Tax=Pistacia integerrima TaxID=434235 RepID=A0ACC0X6E7_9ROSI|nr:hypothetical protein Pint_33759 [Pistacia integerrima]